MSKNHHHSHKTLKGKDLSIVIFLNLAISIAQVIGGLLSGSMALISDALHNFSDVLSLIISWFARHLSARENTEKLTFGYKRTEIMAAFINASTLIGIALYLTYEAIFRILVPHPVKSDIVIWLAVASIVINGLSVLILQAGSKSSMNIKSTYLHLFTDMLTSVAVLIGGLTIKYWGFYRVDGIITLFIAVFLIYSSWNLLNESLNIILMFAPKDIDVKKLASDIEEIKEVKNIHHLHLWRLTDSETHLEAHIDFLENIQLSNFEQKLKAIASIAKAYGISHITIQPEFENYDDKSLIHNV